MIITIDGKSCAGKGTIALGLVKEFGFFHLNTGLIYRYCAYVCLEKEISLQDQAKILEEIAQIELEAFSTPMQLMSLQIAEASSIIAQYKDLRKMLLPIQRNIAKHILNTYFGVVADGRDMGTVVFPQAQLKIFLTANLESRALRRYQQLQSQGFHVIYDSVLEELRTRDERDSKRKVAPMQAARDAVVLDTSECDEETTLKDVIQLVQKCSKLTSL